MQQLHSEFAYAPEAAAHAARFGVAPEIHAIDFIYQHLLEFHPSAPDQDHREQVADHYFADGHRSALRLDGLVRRFHPHAGERRLSLLEFASGYGCVSRHLRKLADHYDLMACDIHPEAVAFLENRLSVPALLSRSDPAELKLERRFDVVFALSFFSHMPHRNWGRWVTALFDCVAEDGLLIFTTHGRIGHEDVKRPELTPLGYWFQPLSEQKDLPTDEYGTTVVTPSYAIERIEACPHAALLFFQEAFWWGKQDTFVVRRVANEFRRPASAPDAVVVQLEAENDRLGIENFRLSTQNRRLTADNARLLADKNALEAETHRLDANLRWCGDALAAVRASRSWHWTRPLRALSGYLGRR